MKAKCLADSGICGFKTTIEISTNDMMEPAQFNIETTCPNIKKLVEKLENISGMEEMSEGFNGKIMTAARETLSAGCTGCIVPAGIFRTLMIASELALPKDASLILTQED